MAAGIVRTKRDVAVASGATLVLASFDGPANGINRVNWAIKSTGTIYAVHVKHIGDDDVELIDTNYGVATSLQEPGAIVSAKTQIVYENTDSVAHTVSADIVGWIEG